MKVLQKFNSTIAHLAANSHDIHRVIAREAHQQCERIVGELRAMGKQHLGVLRFEKDKTAFTFHWELDTEAGIETVEIFREGWDVAIVVVTRPLPWYQKDNHDDMSKFVEHHLSSDPDTMTRQAAATVIDVLDKLTVKWLQVDIVEVSAHNANRVLQFIDLETIK